MCVREDKLTGVGLALTLTVRDCPATAQEWQRMRRAWEKRMKRAGMIRVHWVTEWQRRGVPHLHCAIWFSGTVY
ncbi:rolling circle replication-associated protein, partial [Xylella fastidiosa]